MQAAEPTQRTPVNTQRTLSFLQKHRRVWEKAWCLIIHLLMATGGTKAKNLLAAQWMNVGQGERRWKIKYLLSNLFKLLNGLLFHLHIRNVLRSGRFIFLQLSRICVSPHF